MFIVSLVGYINVGKSSLFNKLMNVEVLVEDKFFVMFDLMICCFEFVNGMMVFMMDMVGFI